MASINNLHSDLLKYIFSYLPQVTIFYVYYTCKKWRQCVKRPRVYLEQFPLSLSVLVWARSKGVTGNNRVMLNAVENSKLDILDWCYNEGIHKPYFDTFDDITRKAASTENVEALKWLLEKDYKLQPTLWNIAAQYGFIKVLDFLHQQQCPWINHATDYAAMHGHTHVLQWIKDRGYSPSPYITKYAAHNGHLETLIWLIENGYPWVPIDGLWEIKIRYPHVYKWIMDNGYPY